jgi:xylulokinase
MDEKAKGAVIGITLSSNKEDIYKALIEGTCYECALIVDAVKKSGIQINKFIVNGGGSRSKLWLRIKADVLGIPIYTINCVDTGTHGIAMLAAVIAGEYSSLEEAAQIMINYGEEISPNLSNHAIHAERIEQYCTMYDKLKDINHLLG